MNATAFVVGPQNGPGHDALAELALSLGFASVAAYAGRGPAERQSAITPLIFFFCAAVRDVKSLKATAQSIRRSLSPALRFAPLIYFARQPAVETIRASISMGFDDVIALPYGGGSIGERILRQVGQPRIYTETDSYFGPDRRDRTPADVEGQVRRIEIMRSPRTGIAVLNDDVQVVV